MWASDQQGPEDQAFWMDVDPTKVPPRERLTGGALLILVLRRHALPTSWSFLTLFCRGTETWLPCYADAGLELDCGNLCHNTLASLREGRAPVPSLPP